MRILVALFFALFALNAESNAESTAESATDSTKSADSKSADSANISQSNNIADSTAPADKIDILSSEPLDEELTEGDVQRFVNDGLLDKQSAKVFTQSSEDEDGERTLVNIYKRFAEDSVDEVPSLLENVYGHIGFFGKTNMNKNVNEHFGTFSASVGLKYDFKQVVFLDLGIYGMMPFAGANLYKKFAPNPPSNFTLHRANVKYVARDEFQNEFFDITAGRFQSRRDWIRNFVQGVSVNANYEWFKLWLDWVDEQATAHREYLSDFDIFKKRYNNRYLLAAGLGASIWGVDVLPYYYYFHKNLWAAGGKARFEIDWANKKWRSVTTAHYVYAKNNRNFGAESANFGAESSGDSAKNISQILWIEEVLRWRFKDNAVSIGLGYIRIFGAAFELANIGNMSRFEDYNTQGYGIMGAGGIDNGGNASNMFFADTQSFYGFVGFKLNDFSMMFLGRNSQGKSLATNLNQHQYSLGVRWRIVDGLYIGGVGAFMMENKVNKSYAKGYVEFRI